MCNTTSVRHGCGHDGEPLITRRCLIAESQSWSCCRPLAPQGIITVKNECISCKGIRKTFERYAGHSRYDPASSVYDLETSLCSPGPSSLSSPPRYPLRESGTDKVVGERESGGTEKRKAAAMDVNIDAVINDHGNANALDPRWEGLAFPTRTGSSSTTTTTLHWRGYNDQDGDSWANSPKNLTVGASSNNNNRIDKMENASTDVRSVVTAINTTKAGPRTSPTIPAMIPEAPQYLEPHHRLRSFRFLFAFSVGSRLPA